MPQYLLSFIPTSPPLPNSPTPPLHARQYAPDVLVGARTLNVVSSVPDEDHVALDPRMLKQWEREANLMVTVRTWRRLCSPQARHATMAALHATRRPLSAGGAHDEIRGRVHGLAQGAAGEAAERGRRRPDADNRRRSSQDQGEAKAASRAVSSLPHSSTPASRVPPRPTLAAAFCLRRLGPRPGGSHRRAAHGLRKEEGAPPQGHAGELARYDQGTPRAPKPPSLAHPFPHTTAVLPPLAPRQATAAAPRGCSSTTRRSSFQACSATRTLPRRCSASSSDKRPATPTASA